MSDEQKVADLFGNGRPVQDKPQMHAHLDRAVAKIEGFFAKDLAAFVVIGVGSNGEWSLGYRVDPDGVIGTRMLAGLAMSAITEELLIEAAVKTILERQQ